MYGHPTEVRRPGALAAICACLFALVCAAGSGLAGWARTAELAPVTLASPPRLVALDASFGRSAKPVVWAVGDRSCDAACEETVQRARTMLEAEGFEVRMVKGSVLADMPRPSDGAHGAMTIVWRKGASWRAADVQTPQLDAHVRRDLRT